MQLMCHLPASRIRSINIDAIRACGQNQLPIRFIRLSDFQYFPRCYFEKAARCVRQTLFGVCRHRDTAKRQTFRRSTIGCRCRISFVTASLSPHGSTAGSMVVTDRVAKPVVVCAETAIVRPWYQGVFASCSQATQQATSQQAGQLC